MLPTPGRRTILGSAAVALALALAGCAKHATANTRLGPVTADPTLAATPGTGVVSGGPSLPPPPSATRSSPKPSTNHATGVSHPPPPVSPPNTWPVLTNEDCVGYNPATVSIVDDGASGYLITDGSSSMLILDNMTDANYALALVRNYSRQCWIGRGNTRTGNDRYRYMVQYWKGTGVPGATLPSPPDCSSYDRNAVTAQNQGATGWLISSGGEGLLLADSQADATNAVALAHRYGSLCFIGRDNTRAMRAQYIVEYWTP